VGPVSISVIGTPFNKDTVLMLFVQCEKERGVVLCQTRCAVSGKLTTAHTVLVLIQNQPRNFPSQLQNDTTE